MNPVAELNAEETIAPAHRVERETVGGSFQTVGTVGAGQTSFSDTGISSTTQYEYRITAFNGGGSSSACETNVITSGNCRLRKIISGP